MSESVPLSARIPADLNAALEAEAKRQGTNKSAALVTLIRAGQSMNADHLVAEVQASKGKAESARWHAKEASDQIATLSSELSEIRGILETTRREMNARTSRAMAGTASGWLGKALGRIRLAPVVPAKKKATKQAR